MSILVGINHVTRYTYDRPVVLGPQLIRLRPAPHSRTPVLSYSLKVTPKDHFVNWQQDPQSNWIARYVFPEKATEFKIEVDFLADMQVINPFDFFIDPDAEMMPFTFSADQRDELASYLAPEPAGPRLKELLCTVPLTSIKTIDFLVGINQRLQGMIKYLVRMEPGVQTPEETLTAGSGSCRDTAWLLVQILRHLGLPARFVSGYLIQLKPDIAALDGPSGTSVDFTDLHAWTEVYIPGAGWIGLDPTSGLLCGEGHLPVAATPHYRSAAPITGGVEAAGVTFAFEMNVSRIAEKPRVTAPFSDAAWAALDHLGETIDADLKAQDVRLTMGGEPTFVSIDDYQSAEWNTAALGDTKRIRADDLIRRLQKRFAPGGLLHYGQGKWYPGEPLPRWAFGLYWRKDGVPLWQDLALFAKEGTEYKASVEDARKFSEQVAERLGIARSYVIPAYEDPLHRMLKESELPENIDPSNPKIDDPVERDRIRRNFEKQVTVPTGFVLPVQPWNAQAKSGWVSEAWKLRRDRLFLLPGDSPVGFRLPLESLPAIKPHEQPFMGPADPHSPRGPLPSPEVLFQTADNRRTAVLKADDPRNEDAWAKALAKKPDVPVRTAMAIEPRDGRICVFMPPTERLEDYLDLLAAVEATAANLKLAIHIEGYTAPNDPRLNVIKVTPDPGVIEVNIHPANNWREAVDITGGVYEEARLSRLGTDKFMTDGRHTGTGGGNHVVLGGATAPDSPFLRRPDLLKSILLYWQRRPSLSYLFSGLFIGPTSQAPRFDEARQDVLHECEIALGLVPPPGQGTPPSPWLVDRLFRNILVDVTGNTHRAEICIDKLFSPDSPTGRLGLIEFRSFEMPPDARMSLAQQILLRALIASFWRKPLEGTLVRWGTALHDRFMLEHFVWEDFLDVLEDLRHQGYDFSSEWYDAQRQFRFPHYGEVTHSGVTLQLRHALEPWHVLGEETTAGGTARFVDSSVERLQVKVDGITEGRHLITVNGRLLPLTSTGRPGEYVAGVRFKAWPLSAALHPTIPVHTPLTFDIFDSWSGRSLGGCVYHVAHPGGRNYETFPINSYEAEARRRTRFQNHGHSPGPQARIPQVERITEYPLTLDLRRPVPSS
jgi:uncharacterized protein (DUF2126 family)/transglutaminase-like putative cysteine protease